jgi:hypothetical protein
VELLLSPFSSLTPFRLLLLFIQADGYDPKKSKVNADRMEEFIQAQISGDLNEVPGIGPAAIKALKNSDTQVVTNTYQLLGVYYSLKSTSDDGTLLDSFVHNDTFWFWLKSRGIAAHRSAVVEAIARKANSFTPGFYDPTDYEESSDKEA